MSIKKHSYPPALAQTVWSYDLAPEKFKKLFGAPPEGFKAFILWERRAAPEGVVVWVNPDGVWWQLWHNFEKHELNATTDVYLLIEKTPSAKVHQRQEKA